MSFNRLRLVAALTTLILFSSAAWADRDRVWIGSWTTSPTGLPTVAKLGTRTLPAPAVVKGTLRYRMRLSRGGSQIRLRLSNEYGETPLALRAVSVGIADKDLDVVAGTLRQVTFAGQRAIVVPAGAPALSDPVSLPVETLGDVIVSVYVPDGVAIVTWPEDDASTATSAISIDADTTQMERLPASKRLEVRPIVSGINVLAERSRKVVVALGDSITDGSIDPTTGERGWPGALSRRVREKGISVVNAGIGGNRLLQSVQFMGASAPSRLDQDVFAVPGLTHIILLEGINDIGLSGPGGIFGDSPLVRAEEMIAAYSQIIARAHERGVKIFGGTILPFAGAIYYSAEKEKIRTAVNAWIRTSGAFDAVIDFDAGLRDAQQPQRLRAEYDPGDHLHPNAAGHRKMAEIVDLQLFD